MKPLIKHVGGKSKEIKYFEKYIPNTFNNYVEPFVGGGAVFFHLKHSKNIINDYDFFISYLYKLIKEQNKDFFILLDKLNEIHNIGYKYFINSNLTKINNVDKLLLKELNQLNTSIFNKEILIKYITDEINKSIGCFNKNTDKQHYHHNYYIIKGYLQGLYYYIRNIFNEILTKDNFYKTPFKIAIYVYIKEYAYSGLVRYNKKGEFNVPFAGFSYMKKDFKNKIKLFKNKNYVNLLNNTLIEQLDFEDFFKKYNYFNKNDFIFLDPPYDTDFKNYISQKEFNKQEHKRLKKELKKVNAKWLMIINNNDFIYNLYKQDFNIKEIYDLRYNINIKNRINKKNQHLIITNY